MWVIPRNGWDCWYTIGVLGTKFQTQLWHRWHCWYVQLIPRHGCCCSYDRCYLRVLVTKNLFGVCDRNKDFDNGEISKELAIKIKQFCSVRSIMDHFHWHDYNWYTSVSIILRLEVAFFWNRGWLYRELLYGDENQNNIFYRGALLLVEKNIENYELCLYSTDLISTCAWGKPTIERYFLYYSLVLITIYFFRWEHLLVFAIVKAVWDAVRTQVVQISTVLEYTVCPVHGWVLKLFKQRGLSCSRCAIWRNLLVFRKRTYGNPNSPTQMRKVFIFV